MSESPQYAVRRLANTKIEAGFKPEALHVYQDAQGNVLFWRIRLRNADGDKWIRPMRLNGQGYELGEPEFRDGKPLYRLPEIAADTDATVWLVEGEKPADALAQRNVVATTSGGADSARKVDWSPLAGRDVVVWPDNDEAGLKYAKAAREAIQAAGASSIRIVDVQPLGLDQGGDAADWLKINPDAQLDDLRTVAPPHPSPTKESNRLCVMEIGAFLSLHLPERDNVLAPWLPAQGIAMVHAQRGIGKTHVALGVAYAVACGGQFLGWQAPQPRGVLFIDGEMPARTLQERLAHIVEAADLEPSAPLRLLTPDMQAEGMPDLTDPDDQARVDSYTEGIELIIVDNISTLCRWARRMRPRAG